MPSPVSSSWMLLTVLAWLLPGLEAQAVVEEPPTSSGQSATLHGSGVLEHLNIPLAGAQPPPNTDPAKCQWKSIVLHNGNLVGLGGEKPCKGAALVGATFVAPFAGELIELRITSVHTYSSAFSSKAELPNFKYRVTWRWAHGTPSFGRDPELCPATGGEQTRFAFAVPHAWSTSGELLNNPDYFTFACAPAQPVGGGRAKRSLVGGGAIAKCIEWGFPPWSIGRDGDERARNLHQACVRMATADYCGEGKVNTLEGTPIAFATVETAAGDAAGDITYPGEAPGTRWLQPGPLGDPQIYNFEAAWGINDCGEVRVLCLSKARWDSLSLDGACVSQAVRASLRGTDGKTRLLSICDNETVQSLKAKGAVLFSFSPFIDRTLVTFQATTTPPSFVTTSRTVAANPTTSPKDLFLLKKEDPQITNPKDYVQLRVEGTVIAPDASESSVPQSIWNQRIGLYRCANAGQKGYYLMPQKDGQPTNPCASTGGQMLGLEGYALDPMLTKSKARPLYLWRQVVTDPATKNPTQYYATSTLRPPGDYHLAMPTPIAYLLVMNQLAELAAKEAFPPAK